MEPIGDNRDNDRAQVSCIYIIYALLHYMCNSITDAQLN